MIIKQLKAEYDELSEDEKEEFLIPEFEDYIEFLYSSGIIREDKNDKFHFTEGNE